MARFHDLLELKEYQVVTQLNYLVDKQCSVIEIMPDAKAAL